MKNLEKYYMTKKSGYKKPSFLKIFAILFVGSAVLCGIWDSATGKTNDQTAQPTQATSKTAQTSKEEPKTKKSEESTDPTSEKTFDSLDKKAEKQAKTVKMNGSQAAVRTMVDQLTGYASNFMNEADTMSSNSADVETLKGSVEVLEKILNDLNAIDPEGLLNGGDFKDPADYDTVLLYIQTPIGRLIRNIQATVDLSKAYIYGNATQETLDTYNQLTADAGTIGSDVAALKGMAENKDIWK